MSNLILVVVEIVVNFGSVTVLFSTFLLFHKNTGLGSGTLVDGELKLSFSPPVLVCLLPIVSQRE